MSDLLDLSSADLAEVLLGSAVDHANDTALGRALRRWEERTGQTEEANAIAAFGSSI